MSLRHACAKVIEGLESRRLMATITGNVFNDVNANAVRETGEGLYTQYGNSVYIDVNNDGSVNQADVNFEVTNILETKFGDTDTDGDVDLNDLGNLASGFQVPGEKRWSRGNFDCDNDVDLPDLGTLATNFQAGRAAAYAEFQTLIPEPSAGLLLLSVLPAMIRRRR